MERKALADYEITIKMSHMSQASFPELDPAAQETGVLEPQG